MAARLIVIGAILLVLGLTGVLHHGPWSVVAGAVLLAGGAAAMVWKRSRGIPAGRGRGRQ